MIWILDNPQGGGNNNYVDEPTAHKVGQTPAIHGTAPGQLVTNQIHTSNTTFQYAHS